MTLAHTERHFSQNKKQMTGANRYQRLCEWVSLTLTENPWGPPHDSFRETQSTRVLSLQRMRCYETQESAVYLHVLISSMFLDGEKHSPDAGTEDRPKAGRGKEGSHPRPKDPRPGRAGFYRRRRVSRRRAMAGRSRLGS